MKQSLHSNWKAESRWISAAAFGVAVLFTQAANAEPRTFTSSDGRTLTAELVSATSDQATLKLQNGSTVATPIARFSKEDQDHIASWRAANPTAGIKYQFDVAYSKETVNKATAAGGFATQATKVDWVIHLKIRNRSGMPLENVELNYNVYYNGLSDGGTDRILRSKSGNLKIESIKQNEEIVLDTAPIGLVKTELDRNYYYADGSRRKQSESIEGIAVTFVHQGKEAFNFLSRGLPAGASGMTSKGLGPRPGSSSP